MLVVETISKIRRWYFQEGRPIKRICRDLGVSRKTVRKVIRSGATEFTYERSVQPQPKLGPWREELDRMLAENAHRPKRERLTRIRIFEDLRAQGYEGGYDAVRRYAASWSKATSEASADAYVPLSFDPGEAFQFDWSHEVAVIDGVATTIKVAHVRLSHSRMVFVRAYPRETQEMVFDAHDKAFAFFGGACTRGIYDNMRTAVDAVFTGKQRTYNRRFVQMCSHYLVDPVACTPASGWGEPCRATGPSDSGERAGREPGGHRPAALLRAAGEGEELRRAQRLAGRPLRRVGEGAPASGDAGAHDLGDLRRGTAEPRAVSRSLRRLQCRAGLGVEDLPRPLRQQQVLGLRLRGRPPCRDPGLCRAARDPPG